MKINGVQHLTLMVQEMSQAKNAKELKLQKSFSYCLDVVSRPISLDVIAEGGCFQLGNQKKP